VFQHTPNFHPKTLAMPDASFFAGISRSSVVSLKSFIFPEAFAEWTLRLRSKTNGLGFFNCSRECNSR